MIVVRILQLTKQAKLRCSYRVESSNWMSLFYLLIQTFVPHVTAIWAKFQDISASHKSVGRRGIRDWSLYNRRQSIQLCMIVRVYSNGKTNPEVNLIPRFTPLPLLCEVQEELVLHVKPCHYQCLNEFELGFFFFSWITLLSVSSRLTRANTSYGIRKLWYTFLMAHLL